MVEIKVEAPAERVYTPDVVSEYEGIRIDTAPIKNYEGMIRPHKIEEAVKRGEACVKEITDNKIADFERDIAYCEKHGIENPDLMVHVSTYVIIDGIVYMTYYANNGNEHEDPTYQSARLAFCPLDKPEEMQIVEIQKVGDVLDGKKITLLYDTILMYKGGDELYVMWTASPENNYYRFYRTFNIKTHTLGPIKANRFKVGDVVNDFSISGMKNALAANKIGYKHMHSDIGIMQKLSTRVENGETYYYTGAYSFNFNCIIKSRDFITWEYVSTPDFINNSLWENATYVLNDKVYYFVRQWECEQGFLTCYDIKNDSWATPTLIADCQSRSDFIYYNDELYLFHAPKDRNGFGMVKVNREDLSKSEVVFVADMKSSLFYPFVSVYGDDAYISYTVDRKHIRLSKFSLKNYVK